MNTLACRKNHVIAGDLDDTLVATLQHPEQARRASDEALRHIGSLVTGLRAQGETLFFGSATGRTFASIQQLAATRRVFGEVVGLMDFHVASVGSAIYKRVGDPAHFTRLAKWPGNPSGDDWDRPALVDALSRHPDLTLQDPIAQDTHKISYHTTGHEETTAHAVGIRSYIGMAGLRADVIVSGSESWRSVDVLPRGVNKGSALLQLPRLLEDNQNNHSINRPAPAEDPICRIIAGDSTNDQAALAVADVAIIPANGHPELLAWAAEQQPIRSIYIADKEYAAGVLQGLQQHLFG